MFFFKVFVNIFSSYVIKKLKPNKPSHTGGVFQTMMFGRCENHVIKDFFFGEIQEHMHDFACQCRDDERNQKGMPITYKMHLTDRRG